jgi:hypothetical protein
MSNLTTDYDNLGTFSRASNRADAPAILTKLSDFIYDPPDGFIATEWWYRYSYYRDYPNGYHDANNNYYPGYKQSDFSATAIYATDTQPNDSSIPYGNSLPPNWTLISTGLTNRSGTDVGDGWVDDWIFGAVVTSVRVFGYIPAPNLNKPNYRSLLDGYELDNRIVPNYPLVTPSETKKILIKYYSINRLEPIPDLKSICWMVYECDLVKDIPIKLPIFDCVLGTLYSDYPNFTALLNTATNLSGHYAWMCLLPPAIPDLFNEWMSLYTPTNLPNAGTDQRVLCKLAANNNIWNNSDLSNNVDIVPRSGNTHPMFSISDSLAYQWHIQAIGNDGDYGSLIMDSIRTIQIHAALNAGKWGVNPDNPTVPRLINLGWFIEKIAWFFGIRPKSDGKIDTVKDKASVRQVIDRNKVLDPEKIGVNSFGEDGMVLTRINNRFNGTDIVSDKCVIVKDFIQIVQEYFEQTNLALGIQESSAIEIKRDKTTARFNNQLEILVELVNLMSSGNEMIRANLVSSLVTQSQSNEIIAGLGLPSVTKTIPFKMEDKIYHLPYKGIAAHRSISQEIATCTYNVGLVTGQLI